MMNNSILGAINQGTGAQITQNLQNLKGIADILRASQNPQQLIAIAAQKNPLFQQAQKIADQYGGNYDVAFYELCNQYGINPNEVMSALRGIM